MPGSTKPRTTFHSGGPGACPWRGVFEDIDRARKGRMTAADVWSLQPAKRAEYRQFFDTHGVPWRALYSQLDECADGMSFEDFDAWVASRGGKPYASTEAWATKSRGVTAPVPSMRVQVVLQEGANGGADAAKTLEVHPSERIADTIRREMGLGLQALNVKRVRANGVRPPMWRPELREKDTFQAASMSRRRAVSSP
jgi:hypothetical protein